MRGPGRLMEASLDRGRAAPVRLAERRDGGRRQTCCTGPPVVYVAGMPTAQIEIAAARGQWRPAAPYLNTASYGLPPDSAWDAMQAALADWRAGRTSWEHWGDATDGARAAFARIVGVAPEAVAVGATVSELVGLVAASLPARTRVVAPDIDFASVLFPFLVQAERGALDVRLVAPAALADAIDDSTDVVAFSAVLMASGEDADIQAFRRSPSPLRTKTVL